MKITKQRASKLWRIFRKFKNRAESNINRIVREWLAQNSKKLAQLAVKIQKQSEEEKEWTALFAGLVALITRHLTALSESVGGAALDAINADVVFDSLSPAIVKYIDGVGLNLVKVFDENLTAMFKEALVAGTEAGETIPELIRRLEAEAVEYQTKRWQIERLVRTETADAATHAEVEAYKQSGFVKEKEWLTDADPCPFCAAMSGQRAKLDDDFPGDGYGPPKHPNCTCDIIPILERG